MIDAWQQQSDPIGLFVGLASVPLVHTAVGDKAHRFVIRDHAMPLMVHMDPHTPLRSLVSCLAIGRRVGCFLHEENDISHAARRILAAAPGHVSHLPTAVWNGGAWSRHLLHELA